MTQRLKYINESKWIKDYSNAQDEHLR